MKVTVITPSYNQAPYIERTLASVASQGGAQIEHLVFDGGSDDGTVAILERSATQWTSGKDAGQADAVNKGLRAATGEVIGWLNSDDVYYPGAVARAVAWLEAHPDMDVVYGRADHIDVHDAAFEEYPTEPFDLERLKETCFICQPALFLRRRVIERHGVLDASLRYCMDYEYWLRLAVGGARFGYLREKLAGSRLYAETKTLGSRLPVHEEINDMLARTLGAVPDRWLANYAFARVESAGHTGALRRPLALLAAIGASRRWNRRWPGPSFWRAVAFQRQDVRRDPTSGAESHRQNS